MGFIGKLQALKADITNCREILDTIDSKSSNDFIEQALFQINSLLEKYWNQNFKNLLLKSSGQHTNPVNCREPAYDITNRIITKLGEIEKYSKKVIPNTNFNPRLVSLFKELFTEKGRSSIQKDIDLIISCRH
tara:strand:+ start:132 stop:530 length:399 start_codon:yes stop_codon:yes gene_type:complete